ncbi:MAG: archaellin/type IV pilin N-terminal domain-containing protein [Acidilobaceae archaeon]
MKKAISPVVATVILIAVTIVIGVAVAGWLMGIWGGLGGTEALKIYPNATLKDNELKFTVKNEGSRDAKLISVRVEGLGDCSDFQPEVVKVGAITTITCEIKDKEATPGAVYTVRVYTEAGNAYPFQVTAQGAEAQGTGTQTGTQGTTPQAMAS